MLAMNLGLLLYPHFLHPISKTPFELVRFQMFQIYFFLCSFTLSILAYRQKEKWACQYTQLFFFF